MFDLILVSIFVLGAGTYLAFLLRKRIRDLRNPKSSAACGCACGCAKKKFEKNSKPQR